MKTMKFLSLLLIGFSLQAQDLQDAKNTIDSEQYQKAKTILKSLINTKPDRGENFFYLADIYLMQKDMDSARIYFNQGLQAKNNAHLNYIGLGHIDLNNNSIQAAVTNFNKATEKIRKRDSQEFIQIGRAYTNSDNPDYKKAIEYLNKAIQADPKSADAYLFLGDAYLAEKNTSDAYRMYREALAIDKNKKKAKLQMAVIIKNSKNFDQAMKSLNELVEEYPNYGPVYREIAETYYFWATTQTEMEKYKEYNNKALEFYKKYMNLTDTSLDSRMRYADFLILTKDYATLEVEASKMKNELNVNPRIYRYLGYAAFENKNYAESITALTNFFQKGIKFIPRDYLTLAKAKLAVTKTQDGQIDMTKFEEALADLESAVKHDVSAASEFSELGEELYKSKSYLAAAKVFILSVKDESSKNFALDNLYLGNSVLFYVSPLQNDDTLTEEQIAENTELLQIADRAYQKVIDFSPTTQDAHVNKAKINRLINTPESLEKATESYQNYIEVVTEKGETEMTKARTKRELLAAHLFLAAQHTDKSNKNKAIEHFEKALSLDPSEENREYINQSIEVLKG